MNGTDSGPREWFERLPERLAWELAEFKARALPAKQRKEEVNEAGGSLVIETELPFKGKQVAIAVEYPFDFPDSPPSFESAVRLIDRHQSPSGNLCVLGDSSADWWPGRGAAELVDENLRWLLEDSEKGLDSVLAREEPMPEPASGYVSYDMGVVVVGDPHFALELSSDGGNCELAEIRGDRGRYVLAEAAGLGAASPLLADLATSGRSPGWWISLDDPVRLLGSTEDLIAYIEEAHPKAYGQLGRRLKKSRRLAAVEQWIGLTFLEEGPRQGERRRNWIFARARLDRDGSRSLTNMTQTQSLTEQERMLRTPELVGLGEETVLIVGAGSLGAPVSLGLAKAGVGTINVLDKDTYDVNNGVRHELPIIHAGRRKAQAVAEMAAALNPFVSVAPASVKIGANHVHAKALDLFVANSDLVIDTTGSPSVARILQRVCRLHGRPLLLGGLSSGAYGGEVAIFRPGKACYYCMMFARRSGAVVEPEAAPRSDVTPVGCSHPAFTGAGFDASELAAIITRKVVQALGSSSYPASDWDWAVVNFRGSPRWQEGSLERHPECPYCP